METQVELIMKYGSVLKGLYWQHNRKRALRECIPPLGCTIGHDGSVVNILQASSLGIQWYSRTSIIQLSTHLPTLCIIQTCLKSLNFQETMQINGTHTFIFPN